MGEVLGADGKLRCSKCGEELEKELPFPLLDGSGRTEMRTIRRSCKCDRDAREAKENRFKFQETQAKIDELRKLSLMDARLKGITFENYKQTQENAKAISIARKYVDKFDSMYEKGQGILFWGDVGTGKSFTAAAIANELLNKQIPVVMTSFIKLLDVMRGFESGNAAYIERLNQAKLLVVDDLGAERGTDFTLEKVYDVIDSRYRAQKPIIITTNLSFSEMKACTDIRYTRIYDRLFEMCYPVKMEGLSWRKKEAVTRFEEMKKLLEE